MSTPQPPAEEHNPWAPPRHAAPPPAGPPPAAQAPVPPAAAPPAPAVSEGSPPAAWPQAARRFNRMAAWSLPAAIVVFPLGLVLALLALARTGERGERGRGLAIGALAIAALEVVVLAIGLSATMLTSDDPRLRSAGSIGLSRDTRGDGHEREREREPEEDTPEGREISVHDIEVGDCFDYGDFDALETVAVTRLSCEDPHQAEVYAVVEAEEFESYPGDREMGDWSYAACLDEIGAYVLDTWALPGTTFPTMYYPTSRSWASGDREISCILDTAEGERTNGSLRADADDFDEIQLRYLEITTPLETVLWSEPLEDEELALRREWAERLIGSVEAEVAALDEAAWPEDVAGAVADLTEAREAGLAHWRDAAEAESAEAFTGFAEAGYYELGVEYEFEIREGLGLTTG